MIIFGTRGNYLKQQSDAYNCPNCDSVNTVRIIFFQRYFHIFWIPIFPTSKIGMSQCSNCKQALYANEMPQNLQLAYNESRKKAKTPLIHFFGLFIIALFFGFAIISVVWLSITDSKYAKNPMVGDVYTVNLANNGYTYYKIKEIKGDTVIFAVHDYTSETLSGLHNLDKQYEDAYGTERIKFAKGDIKGHLGTARISNIDRD